MDPVGRTRLPRHLRSQHGFDGIVHAGAVRTNYEEIETDAAHSRPKSDRVNRRV
jgi:hypothetical protein